MNSVVFIIATVIMFLSMLFHAYGTYLYRQEEESFTFIAHLVVTIIMAWGTVLGIFLCVIFSGA